MSETGHRGRTANRWARPPFRQGDLDGLCGIYCVVNAVRVLCPELDGQTAEALFAKLIRSLPAAGVETSLAVTWGIDCGVVSKVINTAVRFMADEYAVTLRGRRLPKPLRRTTNRDELWSALAGALSPHCVALLGLGGRHSHWTVAVSATSQQIELYDSVRMGVLRRRQCSARSIANRTVIWPPYVFLLERMDD